MTVSIDDAPAPGAGERLLTPREVGRLFRVDPKTVIRWARAGWTDPLKTPGGHWRLRESAVLEELRRGGCPGPARPADDQPDGDES